MERKLLWSGLPGILVLAVHWAVDGETSGAQETLLWFRLRAGGLGAAKAKCKWCGLRRHAHTIIVFGSDRSLSTRYIHFEVTLLEWQD